MNKKSPTKLVKLNVRVDLNFRARIAEAAAKRGKSVSDFVRDAIIEAMRHSV